MKTVNSTHETITLTFGDCAENHKSMQKIGEPLKTGFSKKELDEAKKYFEDRGVVCEMVNLNTLLQQSDVKFTPAYLLIIRGGVNSLLNDINCTADDLFNEHVQLKWDSKAFMYGRVVNKKARHNLCYSDFEQTADYENKKGTVINFNSVPILKNIRDKLHTVMGSKKAHELQCEGNRYYDVRNTYIGFHGDAERRIVIAVRLGKSFPLHYQWYHKSEKVGQLYTVVLNHGDMYIMSEKAVGTDWKKSSIYTLRHAAGECYNIGI
jgi:alkylated DNA repair dioxygenase AlkB